VPHARRPNGAGGSCILTPLSEIEARPLEWLWPDRIPLGKVALMAGDPSLGKSLVTLDVAARVSRGLAWPDAPLEPRRAGAGSVILLSAEDDPADTIKPRLLAAGADTAKVSVLRGMKYDDGREGHFSLAADLDKLARELEKLPDVRLIIIDPVSAYMGRTDSHVNAAVRAMLAPLSDLAARRGVAVVLVTHLSKGLGGKAMHRAIGSIAFVGLARAAWHFAADPSDPERRLMLPVKMNLGKTPAGLAYRVETACLDGLGHVPRVAWQAGSVTMTADELLADEAAGDQSRGARQEAADWLKDVLACGPVGANEIKKRANEDGIALRTLVRAKKSLDVRAARDGPDGCWTCQLPDGAALSPQEAAKLRQERLDRRERRLQAYLANLKPEPYVVPIPP
jgi:hypothetical protein